MKTLLRIDACAWENLEATLLSRADVETAAVILAEPIEGDRPLLVARSVEFIPEDGYLVRRADQIRIDPVAINRLIRPARKNGWSIFTVHSHPNSQAAWFSRADDRGDARLLPSFGNQVPGVPHGSVVVARSGDVVGRALTNGNLAPIEIRMVGRTLATLTRTEAVSPEARFARQTLALGAEGQATLRRLRVGVVGLGGGGSVVALQLGHIGVGHLVLVDGDDVEESNLSRIAGGTAGDLGKAKTEVSARYIRALGGDARVRSHDFVGTQDDAARLADCDVIMSCVDRQTPRALLNRLAYEALIPVIDMGTAFRVDSAGALVGSAGRVVVVGPGRPCLACWGHLDPEVLRQEALPPEERAAGIAEGYVAGAVVQQPSVMPFNTMVAGAAVIELLRLVTAFAGTDAPPLRLGFRFEEGTVRRNALAAEGGCKLCGGQPAASDRTLGQPKVA